MQDNNITKTIAHKLSDWAGAVTLAVVFVAGLMYIFQIRSDFDAFVLAHTQHEENCVKEREHLIEDISELKRAVEKLTEKIGIIYFNGRNNLE